MQKILSIDDSEMARLLIRRGVEVLGYEFVEAPDGEAGIKVLEACFEDVALVMLDLNMPGPDGRETLRRLKADERFKSIPVIMVTTENERASIVDCIKSGASGYVVKPFSQSELTTKMVECMGTAPNA